MTRFFLALAALGLIFAAGCASEPQDSRVNLGHGVGSNTAGDNLITRPFGMVVSALLGEGIEIHDVRELRSPEGFLDVQMVGYNRGYGTRRFEYRVEWLDENGFVIPTKTSVWIPVSAAEKSPVTFRFIAPRRDAVDFRINTRKVK
jgi:uncharacterized protein YcfL